LTIKITIKSFNKKESDWHPYKIVLLDISEKDSPNLYWLKNNFNNVKKKPASVNSE